MLVVGQPDRARVELDRLLDLVPAAGEPARARQPLDRASARHESSSSASPAQTRSASSGTASA